jgi:hypothetical protein
LTIKLVHQQIFLHMCPNIGSGITGRRSNDTNKASRTNDHTCFTYNLLQLVDFSTCIQLSNIKFFRLLSKIKPSCERRLNFGL